MERRKAGHKEHWTKQKKTSAGLGFITVKMMFNLLQPTIVNGSRSIPLQHLCQYELQQQWSAPPQKMPPSLHRQPRLRATGEDSDSSCMNFEACSSSISARAARAKGSLQFRGLALCDISSSKGCGHLRCPLSSPVAVAILPLLDYVSPLLMQ